jgi:hypothetical protein
MLADTIEHKSGVVIKIHYDEDLDSTYLRDNDGVLGSIIGHYRGYTFFDGPHDIDAPDGLDLDKECDACEGEGYVPADSEWASERDAYVIGMEPDEKVCRKCDGNQTIPRSLADYFREEHGSSVVLPLFLLDHSGLALTWGRTNILDEVVDDRTATRSSNRFIGDEQGWDTSFIGFAFDSAESRERTGCDWDAERIQESIEIELSEFDKYLRGDCYGYTLEYEGEELEDSCWGFIGFEYVVEEATDAAVRAAKDIEREKNEREYWRQREVLTVE